MNKLKMLETASSEIQVRAQLITIMPAFESAQEEYLKAHGYASGMYDLEVFDHEQFDAAADLLKAAIDAANVQAKRKTALGATNTESGLQNETINQYITIIVNDKDRLPPQAQQFTENFLKMANTIRELQKEYI